MSDEGIKKQKFYYDSRERLQEKSLVPPKRLPPHIIRKICQASTGPGFVCPVCSTRFVLDYGTFGKLRFEDQAAYHCKDCAKAPEFRTVR